MDYSDLLIISKRLEEGTHSRPRVVNKYWTLHPSAYQPDKIQSRTCSWCKLNLLERISNKIRKFPEKAQEPICV